MVAVTIHRTDEGRRLLTDWCEAKLESWPSAERSTFDTSLGRTHVTASGSASGAPAVLWLPGTNFNAALSVDVATTIAPLTRFIVVDLPGQPGLSADEALGRDRMDRYGTWLGEVLAELAEPSVVVAGHSLGAAIALSAPPSDAVEHLVLIGPAGLARVKVTARLLAISLPWLFRPNRRRAEAMTRYMQHESSPVDPDLVAWMELVARHTKQVGAPGPLPPADVERWRSRATIVTGSDDAFFPADRLAKPTGQLLATTVRTIEGAGHLAPDEQPGRLREIVAEHLG